jgi:pyrroline-5-carboxylate reductase
VKLGLIGGGAMGEAIIAAVTRAGVASAADITVAEVAAPRRQQLGELYGVRGVEKEALACEGAGFVLLAVKPQDFEKAAAGLKGRLGGGATVVSIMAGVTLSRLQTLLGHDRVVRAMPNTPAQIGQGMTVWTATAAVDADGRSGAGRIFAALGKEVFVAEERYLDMATALSGSGPAYVFLFIEALIDAGVYVGLSREVATTLAVQTVAGSALYAEQTGKHVAELRNLVSSPAGTTVAALRALEAGGLRAAVTEAVIAAFERSKALGQADET